MNILVVGPAWVGDMVMAQSLFRCLQQRHGSVNIDVLAPAWTEALLARMPEVRDALPMPLGHGQLELAKRWQLGRSLVPRAYDQAIVLPNSFKSALLPRFAGIPLRTGWRGEARGWLLNDCRPLDKAAYPLMVERFAALAYAPGASLPSPLPWPRLQTQAAESVAESLGLDWQRETLVLCPGAEFGPAKQWPARHYGALAAAQIEAGRQVWLLGSTRDSQVAADILDHLPKPLREHCHDLCGHTSLAQAVDLMSLAMAVVSNDSGLMHVAAALQRPLVVIYGSTSPAFTPPLSERAECLSLALDCSPCFKRVCPLQHLRCLHDLAPQQVLQALQRLLASPQAGAYRADPREAGTR